VAAERRGDRLVFEVVQGPGEGSGPGDGDVGPEPVPTALHLELIAALFEDAEAVPGPGGAEVVRFSAG
jgi:hypothetical protein